ncbi:MAG: MFS transporter [Rhodospirillales bacterium]|nr:MAG: MFS transporter [Rhodospirillales bacterium]
MTPRAAPALGMFVVGLGSSIGPLDTALNIALPNLSAAFGLEIRAIQWVVICYVLTYGSLMLVCGKVGDLFGYRRVFRIGLAVSVVGLALCALAPTYNWLLVARVAQGVGTALVLSCGPALATSLFPDAGRTRALATYAGMMAAGAAIGPSLGGFLVQPFGWPAVYWFRVPIALGALLLSFLLPAPSPSAVQRPFDGIGAALLATAMSALLLALATLRMSAGDLTLPAALAAVAVVAGTAFVRRASRVPEPILRPGLFRDLDFAVLNVASVCAYVAGFAILLLVPYYLVGIAGLSTPAAGIALAMAPLGTILGSTVVGRLAAAVGRRRVALAGLIGAAAALAAIGGWTATTPLWLMIAALLAHGVATGLFQVTYSDIVVATLPARDRGVAGSLTMVTRTIGTAGGAAALSALSDSAAQAARATGAPAPAAFLAGFQYALWVVAAALALAILVSLVRPRVWLEADQRAAPPAGREGG